MRPPKGTNAEIRKAQDAMHYFVQMAIVARRSYWGYLRAAAAQRKRIRMLVRQQQGQEQR